MARTTLPAAKKPQAKVAAEKPGKPEKPKETPSEFIASIAVVLVTGLFIITFALQAFEIPSSSMENTLLIGDHVFVDRVIFAPLSKWIGPLLHYRNPQHGDIIVFISPGQPGLYVVKRVIGTPGDRIHLQDGIVYRNGEKLTEPYVLRCNDQPTNAGMCVSYDPYRDNFPNGPPSDARCEGCQEWRLALPSHVQDGELVVPPDSIFAMGDNRDVSLDSRYWGFVPRENVIGRPMFIYWSFETPRGEYLRTSIAERVGFFFQIVLHFFDQTRWSRMFHVVH
jgi:signal peptidase I